MILRHVGLWERAFLYELKRRCCPPLPQIYTALRNRIVAAQPPDRQAHLSLCLDKLMADVQRNLEPKNRDKFTQVRARRACHHVMHALLHLTFCSPEPARATGGTDDPSVRSQNLTTVRHEFRSKV